MGMMEASAMAGVASLGLAALGQFLPRVANGVASLALGTGAAYFRNEGWDSYARYQRKMEQITEPALSDLYRKYLPGYSSCDAETVRAAYAYVNASRCAGWKYEPYFSTTTTPNTNETVEPYLGELLCPGAEGRLYMESHQADAAKYKACLQDPNLTVEGCRHKHIIRMTTDIEQLKADTRSALDVIDLNDSHAKKAAEHKSQAEKSIIGAVLCGVSAVVTAVYANFLHCFKCERTK